jgi:glycyl-tRNA synthetase (class II)
VNFDSFNDHVVTVRERDSIQQVRIGTGALQGCLAERLAGC